MQKITYNAFINQLNKPTLQALNKHFNSIYEVLELAEQELYIIYLAHLLQKGIIHLDENSCYNWDSNKAEFADEKVGYFDEGEWITAYHPSIDSYYQLDTIQEILSKQEKL